uniref:Secreted protein n=1 Tax=Heterorhabditis bacteriophora TaxID=37862 RepID=A0A1I7XHG4_HETBA
MSSSWSMWSPWSFCSNNVKIRVRACSTVRGFKCVGHNKEFQSCNTGFSSKNTLTNNDYDAPDPYSEDRKVAMRQLYQDYDPVVSDGVKCENNILACTTGILF